MLVRYYHDVERAFNRIPIKTPPLRLCLIGLLPLNEELARAFALWTLKQTFVADYDYTTDFYLSSVRPRSTVLVVWATASAFAALSFWGIRLQAFKFAGWHFLK